MASVTFDKTKKEFRLNGKPYFYIKKGEEIIGCELPAVKVRINWIEGTSISFVLENETGVEIGKLRGKSKGYESAYSSQYTPEIDMEVRAWRYHADGSGDDVLKKTIYVGKTTGSISFSFQMMVNEEDFTYANNLEYEQFTVFSLDNCWLEDELGYRKKSSYRPQIPVQAFNYKMKKGTNEISVRDIYNNGNINYDNKYQSCFGSIKNPYNDGETISLNFDSMRVEGNQDEGYRLIIAGQEFRDISLDHTFRVEDDFWFISDHYE